jgi:hypothetical protein
MFNFVQNNIDNAYFQALGDLKQIREVLKQLPAPNKETLKAFCMHLHKVSKVLILLFLYYYEHTTNSKLFTVFRS